MYVITQNDTREGSTTLNVFAGCRATGHPMWKLLPDTGAKVASAAVVYAGISEAIMDAEILTIAGIDVEIRIVHPNEFSLPVLWKRTTEIVNRPIPLQPDMRLNNPGIRGG